METELSDTKLNNITKEMMEGFPVPFTFCGGKYESTLPSLLNENVPLSKVLFVCLKESYKENYKQISAIVKSSNCKLVSFVLDKVPSLVVEDLSFLFNIPEDVRSIVYVDDCLSDCILYLASIKNVPTFFIAQNVDIYSALKYSCPIKIGSIKSEYKFRNRRYVLFDSEKLATAKLSEAYAFIISKVIAIIDYKISRFYDSKDYDFILETLNKCITETYRILDYPEEERSKIILENLFSYFIVSYRTKGYIDSVSSARNCACLLEDSRAEFFAFLKIIRVYEIYFNEEKSHLLEIIDYNEKAKEIESLYSVPAIETLKNYKSQNLKITEKPFIEEIFRETVTNDSTLFETVLKIYSVLGGNVEYNDNRLIKAIKYSGDISESVNGMSLLRESGILELLDL